MKSASRWGFRKVMSRCLVYFTVIYIFFKFSNPIKLVEQVGHSPNFDLYLAHLDHRSRILPNHWGLRVSLLDGAPVISSKAFGMSCSCSPDGRGLRHGAADRTQVLLRSWYDRNAIQTKRPGSPRAFAGACSGFPAIVAILAPDGCAPEAGLPLVLPRAEPVDPLLSDDRPDHGLHLSINRLNFVLDVPRSRPLRISRSSPSPDFSWVLSP